MDKWGCQSMKESKMKVKITIPSLPTPHNFLWCLLTLIYKKTNLFHNVIFNHLPNGFYFFFT